MSPGCSGYEVSASLNPEGSEAGTKPHGHYVEDTSKLESLVQQANGLCWVESPGEYTSANAIAYLDSAILSIWSTIFVAGSGESAMVESNKSKPANHDKWKVGVQGTIYCHVGKSGTSDEFAYAVKNSVNYTVHIYLNPVD